MNYNSVEVVRDIARYVNQLFIGIVIHGGITPFKGGMGIGAFGPGSEEIMKELRKKLDNTCSSDGEYDDFIPAGQLRNWLKDIELLHVSPEHYKLQGDKPIELAHVTVLLTALRVTFGIETPIVVAGYKMLR